MKRKILLVLSLLVFLTALVLLVTGSPILTRAMSEKHGIPWGTLITWLGMIALPVSIFLGTKPLRSPETKRYKLLSVILKASIFLAFLWVPVSYILAGNLSFSFSEKVTFQGGQLAMRWF
jgi:hypothetical protein